MLLVMDHFAHLKTRTLPLSGSNHNFGTLSQIFTRFLHTLSDSWRLNLTFGPRNDELLVLGQKRWLVSQGTHSNTCHQWGAWEARAGWLIWKCVAWDKMPIDLILPTWLVVWIVFFIFPYFRKNNPNWQIFFSGVETTNQPLIFRKLSMVHTLQYFTPWMIFMRSQGNP